MSELEEIKILNYRESVKLSQRALLFGLTISGMFYFIGDSEGTNKLPKLPFLNLEFSSQQSFWIALLILYVSSGLVTLYATNQSLNILKSIDNIKVAQEVAKYPNILVSNQFFRLCLAGALLGVSAGILNKIFGETNIFVATLFFLIHPAFYFSLRFGEEIYNYGHPKDN